MKIYKNLEECKDRTIVRIAFSEDERFFGIKTNHGIIFLYSEPDVKGQIDKNNKLDSVNANSKFVIITDWNKIPSDLLEKLNLKIDLISAEPEQPFIREK